VQIRILAAVLALSLSSFAQVIGGGAKIGGGATFGGSGAVGSFTAVHPAQTITTCGATVSCAITVTSTAAGSTLLLIAEGYLNGSGPRNFSSVNGGMTHCSGASWGNNYSGGNYTFGDCAYLLSTTGGDTTFTWTWDFAPTAQSLHFYEISHTGGAVSIGTITAVSDAACTTCTLGANTLTGGTNYAQYQIWTGGDVMSAITGSYTAVYDTNNFNSAYLLNSASGSAPSVTQASSLTVKGSAIFFYH